MPDFIRRDSLWRRSSASLSSVFDLNRIRKLAGVRSLAWASMIRASDIEDLTETDGRMSAVVRGTMPYSVAIWVDDSKKPRSSRRVRMAIDIAVDWGRYAELYDYSTTRNELRLDDDRRAAVTGTT